MFWSGVLAGLVIGFFLGFIIIMITLTMKEYKLQRDLEIEHNMSFGKETSQGGE